MGHRMSHLPIAQFCGKAWEHDIGSGRHAAVSSAFHAICAGSQDAPGKWALLSEAEQEELGGYQKPADTEFLGHALRYADAEKEVELGLDDFGWSVPFEGAFCPGHMDLGWTVERSLAGIDGGPFVERYAIVGDIKRSKWTSHPESLQLHAYGTAYAQKMGCAGYGLGIWAAKDGEWLWGSRFYELGSEEHNATLERLLYAAGNVSAEYSTGSHCSECWGRLRCPAWALPAALGSTWLAPIAGSTNPTPEELGRVMAAIEAEKELLERARANVEAHYERGTRVLWGDKEWRYVGTGKGRESTSVAAVRAEFGAAAEKVIKVGIPKPSFRKVNA